MIALLEEGCSGGLFGNRIHSLANFPTTVLNGLNSISDIFKLNISGSNLWSAGCTTFTIMGLPDLMQKLYYNDNSERLIALGAIIGAIYINPIPLFWGIELSGASIGGAITALTLSALFSNNAREVQKKAYIPIKRPSNIKAL